GMPWSWRLGTVSGIPIYLHGTFLLLIAIVGLSDWAREQSAVAAGAGVLFVLAVFGTVVLHEFGHALMARRYGIRTRDITLLPIGGVARIERMPEVPRQELWVALAGPAVNIVIAAVTYAVLAAGRLTTPGSWLSLPNDVVGRFLEINIWLAAFNLIPAFPMDGGRALRALLAERLDYVRATRIAASLGQGLAFLFALVGLFSNPILLFIAFFIWMGASSEAQATETRSVLAGVPLSHAMITDFKVLEAGDPLARAVDLVLAGSQHNFPIVERGEIVGVLTREALTAALARTGPATPIADVMDRRFETAEAGEMLEPVFQRLEACRCQVLPVLRGGRLVGIMTPENVAEFVMFSRALRTGGRAFTSATPS
ncbi:MAG: Peptidase, partial [Acidobacteria bacterium]|nr:Peptidase [Acidobacteriota bacterium]